MPFDVLAAIDLREGRVVRLHQGDFNAERVYDESPLAVANRLAVSGAAWLHVVDLDGARRGAPVQHVSIFSLLKEVGAIIRVEVGGGIRDDASVRALLDTGADRVVIGTAALRDPEFIRRLVGEHGADAVTVAIDVRAGRAVGDGWAARAPGREPLDLVRELAGWGIRTFEVTAIDRDGTLSGPDLDVLTQFVETRLGAVIASGGIRSIEDLEAVQAIGCAGAIVGRALYDGLIDLGAAVARLGGPVGGYRPAPGGGTDENERLRADAGLELDGARPAS